MLVQCLFVLELLVEDNLKKILRGLSLELRHLLEGHYDAQGQWLAGDLERRLNEIGVWRDRAPKPLDELPHLSTEDKKARKVLDAYIKLREEAGVPSSEAVAEFVRESTYTWVNRLFALRCMEARGIIDEVILQKEAYGGRSMVHYRYARRDPESSAREDEGLFNVLFDEFTVRARELPAVFDPDAPATALRPSIAVLKRCIALLSGTESVRGQSPARDEVFEAPDAFGWAYQYWQEEEKKRVDALLKSISGFKCQGADIIPKTALYTESYMVKFLVQNSLGALWMGMHPESGLANVWEYYVSDADRAPAARKSVADITFLDPAVGSGHFLLEAFDLLFGMYEEENSLYTPEEIAASILNRNLYGIDIDERATQISLAVLWMRAKERVPTLDIGAEEDLLAEFRLHVVPTNIRLPRGKNHLAAFVSRHPEDKLLEPALRLVFEGLENAHELGSLLQIEEPVERELQRLKAEQDAQAVESLAAHPALFDKATQPHLELRSLGDNDWTAWKDETLARLRRHFDEEAEAADLTSAFFGQTAGKGLDVFDLLARRYDVVAANPPYMGSKNMGVALKAYVARNYTPGKRDLYAAFILRCGELARKGGRVAMVTQQSWMFQRSFADLRALDKEKMAKIKAGEFTGLVRKTTIETLVHLGAGAFAEIGGEVVNVALFVISNTEPSDEHRLSALRLTGPKSAREKEVQLKIALSGRGDNYINQPQQKAFLDIPVAPLAYWLSDTFIQLFLQNKSVVDVGFMGWGVSSSNNARFLRLWWEISARAGRWLPHAKGGTAGRWTGLLHHLVDWDCEGVKLKEFILEKYPYLGRNYEIKIRPYTFGHYGWTYSSMGSGCITARALEPTQTTNAKSPALFLTEAKPEIGAILNSRISSFLLRAIAPPLNIDEGYVGALPLPSDIPASLAACVESCIDLKTYLLKGDIAETNHSIGSLNLEVDVFNRASALLATVEASAESLVFDAFGVSGKDKETVIGETGTPAGWFQLITGYDALPDGASELPDIPMEVRQAHQQQARHMLAPAELDDLKRRLRALYEAGAGARRDSTSDEPNDVEEPSVEEEIDETVEGEAATFSGGRIPIPTETFIEELSVRLETHPVSIYNLLREGIEREGWRCLPEERRLAEDRLAVIVLRLLGHRWPRQIEAGEALPAWADTDGIIPITEMGAEPTLLRRVQARIEEEFDPQANSRDEITQTNGTSRRPETFSLARAQHEFAEIVGADLAKWLAKGFFRRHVSQFRKRPIAWQIESQAASKSGGKGRKTAAASNLGPAFCCLVYYHKLDAGVLSNVRNIYVGELRRRYETELRTLEGVEKPTSDQSSRKVQLESWADELKSLDSQLEQVALSGFGPEKLRRKLRQYAIDDAILSLISRWLKMLTREVQNGPLRSWQDAAHETFLHEDFPLWIHDSVRHLEYTCAAVGPKAPDQETLSVDPSSADLAPIVSNRSKKMVEGALSIACNLWWKQFDDAVLSPIRLQVKQLGVVVKLLEEELETDETRLTVLRRKEITNSRKELKKEITGLKKELRERSGKAGSVRERIEDWRCSECDKWEEWLASQPLYDEIASLDGKRPSPRTVAEFITQESLYAPDLNDGVRVNIAPLQKAGLLAADVLAATDLEKAIADRAEWRADERRWCREGKLPRPGWWKEGREKETRDTHLDEMRRTATDTQT